MLIMLSLAVLSQPKQTQQPKLQQDLSGIANSQLDFGTCHLPQITTELADLMFRGYHWVTIGLLTVQMLRLN